MRYTLLLLPFALQAQSIADVCTAIRHVEVGYWAEYRLSGGDEEASTMRNQMVSTERRDGTDLWWHETIASSEDGDMVIRTLVPGYPFDPADVRELVMQMGEEDPVRMPDEMLAAMRQQGPTPGPLATSFEACAAASVVGWESVTTPVGAIRALHVRPADEPDVDLWLSADVPFGLVRFVGEGFELMLIGRGTDATTAVTRPVRDME